MDMVDRRIYVDPTAVVVGDVTLADGVSIWPNAVLRGDANRIEVGTNSNVQDNSVIHCSHDYPTIIGKDCTVGHCAVVNGATIGDLCIIGMNSTILDGAIIGDECIIGAGAVVTGRMLIPPRSVVLGIPGKVAKHSDESIREKAQRSSENYQKLRDEHITGRYKRHTSW
jgi:carbonic anhydrase/acetyltransferase-like protein (isoleucine patch superfamily)